MKRKPRLDARRRGKYGAVRCEADGYTFDSKREAARYAELKLLQLAGEIHDLDVHPTFDLFAVGEPTGAVHIGRFTPDFTYRGRGGRVVEDVKSLPTRRLAAYRLRKKIFEANYGLAITEVQ